MWRTTAVALALMMSAGTAQAQDAGEDELSIVQYAWSRCQPSESRQIDLQDLVEEPERWHGHCVVVRGYSGERSLFFDAADTRISGHATAEELEGRRVGLYGSQETMERLADLPLRTRISVTAKVSDCQDLKGKNVVMLMGYCHYVGGPILLITDFEPLRGDTH